MSQAGSTGNISQHPVVRKLEQKVQALEKQRSETDLRVKELEGHLKTLEAKVALLVRTVKELQQGMAMEPPLMSFQGPPQPNASNGAVRQLPQESPVSVSPTTPRPQPSAAAPQEPLSIHKIDTVLSHLGIRLVDVHSDTCALEPMNAYGRENLDRLHGDFSLGAVEDFVRGRLELA
ncbi:MAG: hypothetical protein GEEBNDBF_00950 [bacterium]|nr:hypothetical protein [bacterium]